MREITVYKDFETVSPQHRILLLFAPTEIAGPAAVQEELLGANPGCLAQRDVELLYVSNTDQARELREHFEVAEGSFSVLLVGRDRKVHLRLAHPVASDQLCQMIDNILLQDAKI